MEMFLCLFYKRQSLCAFILAMLLLPPGLMKANYALISVIGAQK